MRHAYGYIPKKTNQCPDLECFEVVSESETMYIIEDRNYDTEKIKFTRASGGNVYATAEDLLKALNT